MLSTSTAHMYATTLIAGDSIVDTDSSPVLAILGHVPLTRATKKCKFGFTCNFKKLNSVHVGIICSTFIPICLYY